MSSHEAAQAIADKLTAAGLTVATDPRGVTPPCAVLGPPSLTMDLGCGASAAWSVWLTAPGTANLDAWTVLDELLALVVGVLPIERCDFRMYQVAADSPPIPAYQVQFTEGIEI